MLSYFVLCESFRLVSQARSKNSWRDYEPHTITRKEKGNFTHITFEHFSVSEPSSIYFLNFKLFTDIPGL